MTATSITDFTSQGTTSVLVEQFESVIRSNSRSKLLSPLPAPRRSPKLHASENDLSDDSSVSSMSEGSCVDTIHSSSSHLTDRVSLTRLERNGDDEEASACEEPSRRRRAPKSRNARIWIFVGQRWAHTMKMAYQKDMLCIIINEEAFISVIFEFCSDH